tara:strand:- start:263 stop:454 length:192 start_codon:yes stop_codon:yes gene_type:complete
MKDLNIYSIHRGTRFLVIEEPDGNEYVVTDLRGRQNLQKIYRNLAVELWGEDSVGQGDLLEDV